MSKQQQDEIAILDRVLYLLEERSVSRLSEEDEQFNAFISELYEQVRRQATQLQALHT